MLRKNKSVADWNLPQPLDNDGDERKIGVELEFVGITTQDAANIAQGVLGGTINVESEHRYFVEGTSIGRLKVELDTQFAHAREDDEPELLSKGRELIGNLSRPLVPQEIVTGPLRVNQFSALNEAFIALAAAGAKGTDASLGYAFGLHFNPEVASFAPDYLLSIMRAMTILDPKIRNARQTDLTRQIMGWAKPYTPDYTELIMEAQYNPDISTLIRDYVQLNKGRSHALDMLPVFKYIDKNLVDQLIGDSTAARPTFHYRLPSSRVDDKQWSFLEEWTDWVEVEKLAERMRTEESKVLFQ